MIEQRHNIPKYVWFFGLSALLIGLDQLIKAIVVAVFESEFSSVIIIPHVMNVTYVTNNGAAFSMMSGLTWFLILVTAIMVVICILLMRSKKVTSTAVLFFLSFILAGGLSNLLDRIFRGAVVDYVDLRFWPFEGFAIFNLADCLVVVGAIGFLIFILFEEFFTRKKDGADEP